MFDDWKWKSYNRIVEAVEQTPFKSAAQKRYKALRRKNDIYTTRSGASNPSASDPFSGKINRFGTDRLRFENLKEIINMDAKGYNFEPKDELSPELWENGALRDEINYQLDVIAKDFLDSIGKDIKPVDITLVGSMAGYGWNDTSDIDIHIILDPKDITDDQTIVDDFFSLLKFKWNKKYNIKIYDHDVEVYPQNSKEEFVSDAAYSLLKNKWIVKPKKKEVNINYSAISNKVKDIVGKIDEIKHMMNESDYDDAFENGNDLKDKIRKFRKSGLATGGEYSVENLAFKALRRLGELERLSDYIDESYTKLRSINA